MNNPSRFCPDCGRKSESSDRFCAACGRNLISSNPIKFEKRLWAYALSLTVLVWVVISYTSSKLGGEAPTETVKAGHAAQNLETEDAEILALRSATQRNPDDTEAWLALAQALFSRLDQSPEGASASATAFELIDALSRVLKVKPDNPEAILMMADVSFSQQVFPKAAELYQRFLKLEPENQVVKAKYASTLTFLGDFEGALKELQEVLKKEPKSFHANAYLAITYAQMEKPEKAREIGLRALELAPSPEARQRFQRFLDTLDQVSVKPTRSESQKAEKAIYESVRSNPIAGRKIVSSSSPSKNQVALYFQDFPMQAMPPFARDKFLNGIKEVAKKFPEIERITLIDKPSSKQMEQINLK